MGASTLSALSGVGKGIKWLSNINMGLSFFVLVFFIVFGSTLFGLTALGLGIWDYLISIPGNIFTVWSGSPIESFTASVPAAVQALPDEDLTAVFEAASSPWGTVASFGEGLPASAAGLSADDIAATYAVATESRLSGLSLIHI